LLGSLEPRFTFAAFANSTEAGDVFKINV
jgi:hypothetical protein